MENKELTKFLLYSTDDGATSVQVIADSEGETIWTTQKGMRMMVKVVVALINKQN